MILKTKSPQNVQSAQAIAGQQQEQNVAFFLRRAYKDHPQVLVINDFKFRFNDEVAQIDHLIIYSYGFILIESKSIRGRVKVNQQQEWTRSIGAKWQGMPSPIKQVELQQDLLHGLLDHYRSEILDRMFGIKQGFGGRCWDHLCAVSSDAIIDRKSMPKTVSDKLIKSEFLVEKLDKIMNLRGKYLRLAYITDTRPFFNQQELESVASFLIKQHIASNTAADTETTKATSQTTTEQNSAPLASTPIPAANTAPVQHMPAQAIATEPASLTETETETEKSQTIQIVLRCKHCGESTNYTPMYGKFGYYIHCKQCTKNTPMKQACPHCSSKNTRVKKSKETYTLNCQECGCGQRVV
ncbi:nuclease-related domain-containing protein [Shewanella halifaxensis]|uniref:nuclease-related domain-containing protein n=1 Tax=Shewanella halifaxensis TaxID=271098 RepID=UPI000D5979BD|nr:nuclease-related domain-containing protein [Shewanella halifaxensis]